MNENEFDFTKYLSDDQMKQIAEKVFEDKINTYVDQILQNRISGCGSITDQILFATAEKYVNKLAPQFEEDFLKVCKEEINTPKDIKDETCNQTFRNGLVYRLESAAEKYIAANLETIQNEMKDIILETAKSMIGENFRSKISSKIDMRSILRDVLVELNRIE